MTYTQLPRSQVATLTTDEMIEVDRAMIEDFGILLMQMMENAGRNLADLARTHFLDGKIKQRRIVFLAGTGGNGGGALVCARRLHNWGADVLVVVTKPDAEFTEVPAHQLRILRRMDVPIALADHLDTSTPADLIIDGIIGYSLRGAPCGAAAMMIDWANAHPAPVLSLDVPSGIDAGTGKVSTTCVRSEATMTLALPKNGLLSGEVAPYVGELFLADIGVPPSLYAGDGLGRSVGSLFAGSDIVHLV